MINQQILENVLQAYVYWIQIQNKQKVVYFPQVIDVCEHIVLLEESWGIIEEYRVFWLFLGFTT